MKTQFGPYRCIGVVGRGGMGVVYKGHETSLNRTVAIKVLAESLAHDATVKERFLREARSMAALNDAHIIQIYFIGEDEGRTYFVMEFVDGESLSGVLKRLNRLTPEQAAKLIHQTAQGLAVAHDRGVIHRDIKPGNLMLARRGGVKIADFGIALTAQDLSKKLTTTGEFVGTPGYLSPEVCLGKTVDQRSDIFSLGIVLFECLTGHTPFTDESPLGLMLEVVKADIPDVCVLNDRVDAELSRILSRMIAKDPVDRYQSCHELLADLGRHPALAQGDALEGIARTAAIDPVRSAAGLAAGADTISVTPFRMAASSPLLARIPAAPPARPTARYWLAGSAAVLAVAASAWAFRDDLPFLAAKPAAALADVGAGAGAADFSNVHDSVTTIGDGNPPDSATLASLLEPSSNSLGSAARSRTAAPSGEDPIAELDADYAYATTDDMSSWVPSYLGTTYTSPAYRYAPTPLLPPPSSLGYAPVWPALGVGIGVAAFWAPHRYYAPGYYSAAAPTIAVARVAPPFAAGGGAIVPVPRVYPATIEHGGGGAARPAPVALASASVAPPHMASAPVAAGYAPPARYHSNSSYYASAPVAHVAAAPNAPREVVRSQTVVVHQQHIVPARPAVVRTSAAVVHEHRVNAAKTQTGH